MATGLDVAAGVTGLITFSLKAIKTCTAGIELISKAHNFAKYADRFRAELEWEKHRLEEWHDCVSSAEIDLLSQQRTLDWIRIKGILEQLEIVLTDGEKLEKAYNLRAENIAVGSVGATESTEHDPGSLFDRIRRKMKPTLTTVTAQAINSRTNPWKRVTFAVSGESKIDLLVKDVTSLVDRLWDCLRESDRKFMVRALQFLLRQGIVQTPSRAGFQDLDGVFRPPVPSHYSTEILDTMEVLKNLKELRLKLGVDLVGDEIHLNKASPTIKVPRQLRVKSGEVTAHTVLSSTRELGMYKDRNVLIEWKPFDKTFADKLEHRIETLALLLSEATDTSLGSLPFLGFFRDFGIDRYGFVFELPFASNLVAHEQAYRVVTLLDRLSVGKPSFEERLSIALCLSRALRQLHTVGWLHKGVRSDNVLFCSVETFDKTPTMKGPYLAGYGYARAANITEFSEPAAPGSSAATAIYNHRGSVSGQSYRKFFDIFALGLILVELGLWKKLDTILSDLSPGWRMEIEKDSLNPVMMAGLRDQILSDTGTKTVQSELEASCPPKYVIATKRCLSMAELAPTYFDEIENSIEIETAVVDDLAGCCQRD